MDPATPPRDDARVGPSSGSRASILRALPLVLFAFSIVATAVLVMQRGEDLALLRTLDVPAILLLVVMQAVYLVVQSGRFHVVLVQLADRWVGFWPWLQLFVLGRFLNLFVPQAGNVYRGVESKRLFGVSYTRFVAAFVNAPWVAMVLNFAIGALVVSLLQPAARVGAWPLGALLGLAAVATALAPFVLALLLPLVPRRFRLLAWLHARLAEMLRVTLASLRDGAYLSRVLAWTLAAFVQAVIMLWVCFVAIGVGVGLAEAVAFYVLLQLTTYVAITPGNLGVQELAFAVLATGMGAGAVEGVVVSGLLRVTGVIALLALSLPFGGVQAVRASRGRPAIVLAARDPIAPGAARTRGEGVRTRGDR